MGGEIGVESIEGQGTTFTFYLPAEATDVPKRSGTDTQLTRIKGARALVLDDNRTNRKILEDKLRGWGVEPSCTASPRDALARMAAGEVFDLCIVDYKMQEMSGTDFALLARQELGDALPPLVLFSSISPLTPGFREEIAGAKFSAVLTKPAKSGHLLATLYVVLGGEIAKDDTTVLEAIPDVEIRHLDILLVDDDLINRKVGSKILKRLGYSADLASSSVQAKDHSAAKHYDVILMDIEMPDLDGVTAAAMIRNATTNRPPISLL